MKSLIAVPGVAPGWVCDHARMVADDLTTDGRVLVAFSDPANSGVHLPGSLGGCTLLGISRDGFPIWTGRRLAVWGLRRRQTRSIVLVFEGARPLDTLAAVIVSRLRRERVVVNDLRSSARSGSGRLGTLMVRGAARLAHERTANRHRPADDPRYIAYANCNGDLRFAELMVRVASSMSEEAASEWRFVIQSDHEAVTSMLRERLGSDFVSVEGSVDPDILRVADVVIVAHGERDWLAEDAVHNGSGGVIVGHPLAARVPRRFDGVFLARHDASSVLVALESARGNLSGAGRSAPEVRSAARDLLSVLRSEPTMA